MKAEDIKKLRAKLHLTQQAMADKLGVARSTVARWEAGDKRPSQLAIRQLNRLKRKRAKKT